MIDICGHSERLTSRVSNRQAKAPAVIPLYLIVCWMKRSGSSAAKVARVVSAGTPSSKRMILGLDGKTGASLTSSTLIETAAEDDGEEGIPLAR